MSLANTVNCTYCGLVGDSGHGVIPVSLRQESQA
jgi:hypothetical protein